MEFLKGLPAEYVPLALVLGVLFFIVYATKVLYPILRKKDTEEKGSKECPAHSGVTEKLKDHGKWFDDNERRIVVLEKSVVVLEDHNKRTDQRIEKLEQTVSDLRDLVLPMSGKVENIEKQVSEIHKKIDLFMQKF